MSHTNTGENVSKKLFKRIMSVVVIFVGMIALFQNCSDIRVSQLNSVTSPSECIEPIQISLLNQQVPSPTEVIFQVVSNPEQVPVSEVFVWTLKLEGNVLTEQSSTQLSVPASSLESCRSYEVTINRTAECTGEVIKVDYIHPGNCEPEPPEPPTCEEDPTQPHCNPVDYSCNSVQAPFTVREVNFNTQYHHPMNGYLPTETTMLNMGFGVEFGELIRGAIPPGAGMGNHKQRHIVRNFLSNNNELLSAEIRAFKFVAPENNYGSFHRYHIPHGLVWSISRKCGDFLVAEACYQSATADLIWTSDINSANPRRCKLTPGETYYLNLADFDVQHYRATNEVRQLYDVCALEPTNCITQHNSKRSIRLFQIIDGPGAGGPP